MLLSHPAEEDTDGDESYQQSVVEVKNEQQVYTLHLSKIDSELSRIDSDKTLLSPNSDKTLLSPNSDKTLRSPEADKILVSPENTDGKDEELFPSEHDKNQDRSCCCSIPSCAHVILALCAIAHFYIGFWLSNMDITQLVYQSIPQVAVGFGILMCFIWVLGVLANRRTWVGGFYIQAITLIILMVSEIFIVCNCAFETYEILTTSEIYWEQLNDDGKSQIMANWRCCGWFSCDLSDRSSIYWTFRYFEEVSCFDVVWNDVETWTIDVVTVFSSLVGFEALYIIYICMFKIKRTQNKRKRLVNNEANKIRQSETLAELAMNLSSTISRSMKRLSFFQATSPVVIVGSSEELTDEDKK